VPDNSPSTDQTVSPSPTKPVTATILAVVLRLVPRESLSFVGFCRYSISDPIGAGPDTGAERAARNVSAAPRVRKRSAAPRAKRISPLHHFDLAQIDHVFGNIRCCACHGRWLWVKVDSFGPMENDPDIKLQLPAGIGEVCWDLIMDSLVSLQPLKVDCGRQAICKAFAAEGARVVVVADVNKLARHHCLNFPPGLS
jgi:hypothetical protein